MNQKLRTGALVLVGLMVAGCVVVFAGCGREPSSSLAARLQACGLLTGGEVGDLPFYAPSSCYERCLAAGACYELEGALCDANVELLVRCDQRCAFHCSDGSLIGLERTCDGRSDCADASDEAGCPTFRCRNGATARGGARCDLRGDCVDGSDEEGCAYFECDDGQQLPPERVCDGYPHCSDRRDEEGCPVFRCNSGGGQVVSPDARCDGTPQCGDGSDERGCARISVMCTGS